MLRRPDNPSFKLFEFDVDTNVQINEEVYRLDLAKWNVKSHDHFEYEKAYNYLDYYNVSNMSLETRAWINEQLKVFLNIHIKPARQMMNYSKNITIITYLENNNLLSR